MRKQQMKRYDVELSVPFTANPHFGDMCRKERVRVIGGDKGDVHFFGYDVLDGQTHLRSPVLATRHKDLTQEEAQHIAQDILAFAIESVGEECLY